MGSSTCCLKRETTNYNEIISQRPASTQHDPILDRPNMMQILDYIRPKAHAWAKPADHRGAATGVLNIIIGVARICHGGGTPLKGAFLTP